MCPAEEEEGWGRIQTKCGKEEYEPRTHCHCLCCHQGDERSGAALTVTALMAFFFFLVFFTLCQCSTVNSHSTYDVIPPNIFSEKKSVVLLPLFMYLLIPVLMWKLVPFLIEFIPFFQTMLPASQDFNFDPLSQHTSNPSKLYVARKFNKHVL